MLRKTSLFALTLSAFAVYSQAEATVISVSNLATTSSNVGTVTLDTPYSYTGSGQYVPTVTNYSYTTDLVTEIVTAPTTSAPGLAKDYTLSTEKYDYNVTSYKYDSADLGVFTAGGSASGSKYLTLSGSVTSTIDTTIYFSLNAGGSYLPISSPFGNATPALASLYLGSSVGTLTAAASTYSYTDSSSNQYIVSNSWTYSVDILAGQTLSFSTGAFAPSGASLDYLGLTLETGDYGFVTTTTPYEHITKTLIDAHAIPALSVPEPSTYAMLLAGIGMLGLVRRRRDKASRE